MLATCRSLHAAGYQVDAVASRPFAATHGSRCCAERLRMTDPSVDAERFVEELALQMRTRRYAVLLPGGDTAVLAVSRMRERLEGLARIGLPSPAVVERSLDREVLARAAGEAGLSPTESIRCESVSEALAAARGFGLPVVLKSTQTVHQVGRSVQQAPPSQRVDTEDELTKAVRAHQDAFLIQRTEAGESLSFAGVTVGDRLLGVALARYRRTWPPEAGNAAFAETIPVPPDLRRRIERLVANIGWEGIFEIELIRTADDRFVPIDFNPRPYGSMSLAAAAGAPLPVIWCDFLLDRGPQPAQALPGFRYRWEDGDFRHFARQLRRGRYRAAAETALPHRRVVHAHFQLADPMPLLLRGLYLLRLRLERPDRE
jgi:predicted ATP-grasp superfamily ATP-dependent carboligase